MLAIAASLMVATEVLSDTVSAGAPGWVNLVVLVLAWDAIKVGWLAAAVLVRWLGLGVGRSIGQPDKPASEPLHTVDPCLTISPSSATTPGASGPLRVPKSPTPIADWQVDMLRKAVEARGLTSMTDRQQAIESAAGRAVESLRSLSHDEGLQVLSRLGRKPSSVGATRPSGTTARRTPGSIGYDCPKQALALGSDHDACQLGVRDVDRVGRLLGDHAVARELVEELLFSARISRMRSSTLFSVRSRWTCTVFV